MKVTFIRSRPGEGYVEGQSYEMSDSDARRLVKRGFAVAAERPAEPADEPKSAGKKVAASKSRRGKK
ncbi:hypothetical protein [Mesorhizobium sp.]|uniref:hypothetical protein n=1 Tax=Mesorhizobium sp. TaxID=1871066 RepID=UPI001214055E|nr:hypothetical protein [Mesorhizobium sp.]TIN82642.1 MAG: hypothetical protein E5X97_29215 [Mesorhizobium sp.]